MSGSKSKTEHKKQGAKYPGDIPDEIFTGIGSRLFTRHFANQLGSCKLHPTIVGNYGGRTFEIPAGLVTVDWFVPPIFSFARGSSAVGQIDVGV